MRGPRQRVAAGDANTFESEVECDDYLLLVARSGMTGERGELPGFDAEQPERREPALLVGQIEDHAFIGRHRQPGVVEHLFFELAGFPTRVARAR